MPKLNDGINDLGVVFFEDYYKGGYPWESGYDNQVSGCSVAQHGVDILKTGALYSAAGMRLRDAIRHAEISGIPVPNSAYEHLDSLTYTRDKPAEHTVSYAYPSSPTACRMHRAKDGCFVLAIGKQEVPFASQDDAVQEALGRGTIPSRWSIDHPMNRSLAIANS